MTSYSMPLFPLNTVLFPGVPIFLHIFEPRYREMINRCVTERIPFGVVLIQDGVEAYGRARPFEVGCSAEIVNVQRMEDGRMNIAAVGKERFRILETDDTLSYLQGEVEPIPLEIDMTKPQLLAASSRLRPTIEQYIDALRELSEVQVNWDGLPDDPVELAYLSAYVLQVGASEKQNLLMQNSVLHLVKTLLQEYAIELKVLQSMVEQQRLYPDSAESTFSLN